MLFTLAAALAACLVPTADRITAADVARAVPSLAAAPADTVLSYAPQPGLRRVFAPAEINALLARHALPAQQTTPVCFEWPMRSLAPDEHIAAMKKAIPDAEIAMITGSNYPVPQGILVYDASALPRTPGAVLWKGHVLYTPGKQVEVWARVHVTVVRKRLVAQKAIRAGDLIEPGHIAEETIAGPPAVNDLSDANQALGRVARRHIREGSEITAAALGTARAISKGDSVQVRVVSGAARLHFDGTAEAHAAVGDQVAVRNRETGKVVRARVLGPGQATIIIGGAD